MNFEIINKKIIYIGHFNKDLFEKNIKFDKNEIKYYVDIDNFYDTNFVIQ